MKPERILFLAGVGAILAGLAFRHHGPRQAVVLGAGLLPINFALMLGWSRNKS